MSGINLRYGLLGVFAAFILQSCAVKPNPYATEEYQQQALLYRANIAENQAVLVAPIDLYQAMARALKHNLSYRVKTAEAGLKAAELNLAHHSMLPDVVAGSSYTRRSNVLASSSYNLSDRSQNFSASTSQDREQMAGDLSFSWNILDFGLSYVRAQQAGDKALIAAELKRKVSQNLLEEVRNTYWRAISHQRLSARLQRLDKRIRRARKNAKLISRSGETSPTEALTDERELVKISGSIKQLQRDIDIAKARLAELMNIAPGVPFKLVVRSRVKLPAKIDLSLDQMMTRAIRDRPELHENWYQRRINKREAQAALLELIPSINAYIGPNWNSNSFLLNSDWVAWGAKASWNLLKVFKYPAKSRVLEEQDRVLRARAQALAMSIMTQVNISRINYSQRREELTVARDLHTVQSKLLTQLRQEASADKISENKLLREEMNTLVALAKLDIASAEAQAAFANLFTTMGWDPHIVIDSLMSVDDLASSLRKIWSNPQFQMNDGA